MNNKLEPGDLVYIKSKTTHECSKEYAGRHFTVQPSSGKKFWCGICLHYLDEPTVGVDAKPFRQGFHCGFPASWLVKVPPLGELEETNTKEEIFA